MTNRISRCLRRQKLFMIAASTALLFLRLGSIGTADSSGAYSSGAYSSGAYSSGAYSSGSQSPDPTKTAPFTLNGVSFTHPVIYQPVEHITAEDDTVFFLNQEYADGLFVAVPSSPFNKDALIARIRSAAAQKILPNESQDFVWKKSAYSNKVSKHEIGNNRLQGYNKKIRVVLQFQHLRFKQKDILVGYFFHLEPMPQDAQLFKEGFDGEDMLVADACTHMIASITGEKFEGSALFAGSGIPGGAPGGFPGDAPPPEKNSGPPAQTNAEDMTAIARETVRSSTRLDGLTMIWWMPDEYWHVSLAQFLEQRKMPASQISQLEAVIKPLSYYTMIAAVVAKGEFGKYTYAPESDIRSYIQLLDSEGNAYRPLDEKAINPETKNLLAAMKPVLIKAMSELGPFGENVSVFLFPKTGKSGRRIADAKSDGRFSVLVDKVLLKWRTPVGALLPPKRCPVDGEEVSGGWKFCPWHGAKLPENK